MCLWLSEHIVVLATKLLGVERRLRRALCTSDEVAKEKWRQTDMLNKILKVKRYIAVGEGHYDQRESDVQAR